ncbi:SidA/IucD/PvdA family monooxygenase (plasmid) [Haladaptatus sp. SPP-AMP-3]|uniref:lysine N(6)-hydroxylase/L-ornithine N(5)-oxygenase family protein n=1 Tax=Haladaptatus sp. SPP-AMP-3 TaxID=3121295 RepID=UPI003C2B0877
MAADSFDVIGVGIGPLNLSLAALIDDAGRRLKTRFLERDSEFDWHRDMLIPGTDLQNSFTGDLVSPVDPTSQYSFLNYLKTKDRYWEFFNYEQFNIPRKEYNEYCRWVSERLENCRFDREVTTVSEDDDGAFVVRARNPETGERHEYRADNIVLGVGSRPYVPDELSGELGEGVFHSSQFLSRRAACLEADSITVVGSGQSSAEIFLNLLRAQEEHGYRLDWLTRSDGFYPVDPSKLTRELRTPDYMDYFYDLPREVSDGRVAQQDLLYKGISPGTSAAIFDTLYRRSIRNDVDVGMLSKTAVQSIESQSKGRYRLRCHQWEEDRLFRHDSEVVVLATGYHRPVPSFLEPVEDALVDASGRFSIDRDFEVETNGLAGRLFVQNDGMDAHGFNVADLSLCSHRNAVIINSIVGEEVYSVENGSRFQSFGVEQFVEESPNSELIEKVAFSTD